MGVELTDKNMGWFKAIVGGIVGAALCIGAAVCLAAFGFTTAGIVAGSFAASIQGASVAAGSMFAIAQSVGATGALYAASMKGAAVGAAVGGVLSILKI